MKDLLVAIGLLIAIEGAAYALFPNGMKKILLQVLAQPPSHLRNAGVVAACVGVLIVWLVRS